LCAPLGVNEALSPSPTWLAHDGVIKQAEPLLEFVAAWKSAQNHPDIVKSIQQELNAVSLSRSPEAVCPHHCWQTG
jgi:hypothetical protein